MMKRKNILVFAALTALVAALAVYGVMQYIHTVQEEKQLRMEISGYTVAGEALLDAARADTANEDAYAWRYRQMLLAAGAVEARWDTAIGMRFREDRYDQGKTFVLAVIDTPSMFLPVSLEEAGQEEESLARDILQGRNRQPGNFCCDSVNMNMAAIFFGNLLLRENVCDQTNQSFRSCAPNGC